MYQMVDRPAPDQGTVTVVSLTPVDDALVTEWDALARSCAAPPFLRPGWVLTWFAAFHPRTVPHVVVARRGGRVLGVLPVLVGRGHLRSASNSETPLVGPVAQSQEVLEALLGGALGATRWSVRLDFLAQEGPAARTLARWSRDERLRAVQLVRRSSPYVEVDGDWDDYQKQTLPESRRRSIRKKWRRLHEHGRVGFTVHDGREDLARLLAEGLAVDAASWKSGQRTAVLSRPATTGFYRRMAAWAARAGILRLAMLRVDGVAVAFALALEQDDELSVLKSSYLPEWRAFGPGVLLTHRLIEHAFTQAHLRRYEMLGEAEPYKLPFAHGTHDQVLVHAFADGLRGTANRAVVEGVVGLRGAVRRHVPEATRLRLVGAVTRIRP